MNNVPSTGDPRQPLELRISVLATEEQAVALLDSIGEAVCGAPLDHDGPCRIAWSSWVESELTRKQKAWIWEDLAPIETLAQDAVDRSLGLS